MSLADGDRRKFARYYDELISRPIMRQLDGAPYYNVGEWSDRPELLGHDQRRSRISLLAPYQLLRRGFPCAPVIGEVQCIDLRRLSLLSQDADRSRLWAL